MGVRVLRVTQELLMQALNLPDNTHLIDVPVWDAEVGIVRLLIEHPDIPPMTDDLGGRYIGVDYTEHTVHATQRTIESKWRVS